jgi:hypothetical protein
MPDQTATSVPDQSSGGGIDLSDLRIRTLQQAKSELPDPAKHTFLTEEPTLTDPNSLTGKAQKLASSLDSAVSERVFKPFRQGLNNMGSDLQDASLSGHTRTGGQLTGPARALAGAAGTALKWVPVGENLRDTAAMSVVPPELGPEGKALSKEIQASQKFTKYTKAQMLDEGADGYLNSAVKAHIPLDMIEGHEPTPAMEGGYKKGTPITQPIEVRRNPQSGKYTLYSGNHRVEQARVNEQTSIPAFIEGATKQDLESFAEVPKIDLSEGAGEKAAPSFQKWFNKSKVTDEKGDPLRVYHGTRASKDFSEFETEGRPQTESEEGEYSTSGSGPDSTSYMGAHFAKEPEVANKFASGKGVDWLQSRYEAGQEKPRVIPAYLSLQNPKNFGTERNLRNFINEGKLSGYDGDELLNRAMEADGILEPHEGGEEVDQWLANYDKDPKFRAEQHEWLFEHYRPEEGEEDSLDNAAQDLAQQAKSRLKEAGHDGMVYKNEVEGGTAYTAFEPHQIRHAITQGPQVDLRGLRVRPAETSAPKASEVPNLDGLRIRNVKPQQE